MSPEGELEVFLWASVRRWCRSRQICLSLLWDSGNVNSALHHGYLEDRGGGGLAWQVGEDVPIKVLHLGVFRKKR